MGMSDHSLSLTLLAPLMNKLVLVETPSGMFSIVLRKAEISQHGEIGCLLLENREEWLLIISWTTVKRA